MLNKKDPFMLLSIVNMKLRDEDLDLDELCRTYDGNKEEIIEKLANVGYTYNKEANQFVSA